ncbi:MAG: hypothetical protein HRU70_00200 [Phycisphaeraceae bacterium]|nr:MAG: hypothetical protein HRU70_00200 [Phycisphaeraceae bacterium]
MATQRSPARPSRLSALAAALALPLLAGCFGSTPAKTLLDSSRFGAGGQDDAKLIEVDDLTAIIAAYADSWVAHVRSAADRIAGTHPDLPARRAAQRFLTESAISFYDIASKPDPISQVFDVAVAATLLKNVWVDDGRARETFGDAAEPLETALVSLNDDAWTLASRALTETQIDVLAEIIRQWKLANPEVHDVAFVRFRQFADLGGAWLREQVTTSGGLFSSVDQATLAIREVRALGERARWLSVRAPLVISWQSDAAANDLLSKPEVAQALNNLTKASDSAERLTSRIDQLPADLNAQREALFADLDKRQAELNDSIANARAALADAKDLMGPMNELSATSVTIARETAEAIRALETTSGSIRETLQTLDAVLARFDTPHEPGRPTPEPAEPFRIADYTAALAQLTAAVTELNTLLASANATLDSSAWADRLAEINAAADGRIGHAADVAARTADARIDKAASWAVVLLTLAAVFAAALLYLAHRLRGARPAPAR